MKCPLFAVLSGLLLTAMVGCGTKEVPAPPPTEVKVATVLQKDVPIYIEAVGQTRGSTEIEVRARVEGFLQTVDFKEGLSGHEGRTCSTRSTRSPFKQPWPARKACWRKPRQIWPGRGRTWCATSRSWRRTRSPARITRPRSWSSARRRPRSPRHGPRRARPNSTSAIRRWWRPSAAWSARPRCTRARSWGAARAPCSRKSRRSRTSTSGSRYRSATTCITRANGRSAKPRVLRPSICPSSSSSATAPSIPSRARSSSWIATSTPRPVRSCWKRLSRTREASCARGSSPACGWPWTMKQGALLVPQRAVSELQGIYNVAVLQSDDTIEIRAVKAGRADRQPLGHRLRPRSRRADRGRGRAEGPAGREGQGRDHQHRGRSGAGPAAAAPAAAKAPGAQG